MAMLTLREPGKNFSRETVAAAEPRQEETRRMPGARKPLMMMPPMGTGTGTGRRDGCRRSEKFPGCCTTTPFSGACGHLSRLWPCGLPSRWRRSCRRPPWRCHQETVLEATGAVACCRPRVVGEEKKNARRKLPSLGRGSSGCERHHDWSLMRCTCCWIGLRCGPSRGP